MAVLQIQGRVRIRGIQNISLVKMWTKIKELFIIMVEINVS